MLKSVLSGKRLVIVLHIIVWLILFILPLYIFSAEKQRDYSFYIFSNIQTIAFVIIFYLNYLFLVPKLFFNNNKTIYFIISIALIVGFTYSIDIINNYAIHHVTESAYIVLQSEKNIPPPNHFRPGIPSKEIPLYNFIITALLFTGISMGLRFSDKLVQNEKKSKESDREKLNFELDFLKNQINPHFFFNTLNNIYSLVQSNTEDAQKAIIQLSKLMRYVLYESDTKTTLLSKEILFMKNYIELMRLRLSPKVEIEISIPEQFDDVEMTPLLFIPFIENAFKFGVSYREPSFIKIIVKCSQKEVYFYCSNSKNKTNKKADTSSSGVGLENVKKRLHLLYPNKHYLTINETENAFNVTLSINIT